MEFLRDFIDFLSFYKSRHPALFFAEVVSVGLILVLLFWPLIVPGRPARARKRKIVISGRMVFLIAALVVAVIPFVLRVSGWFSQEEEIVVEAESGYVLGIDVSHYSGSINWNEVKISHHPIRFVFIRATMGSSGSDRHFKENWGQAKQHGYLRGAYHYYRPGDDPVMQFRNFSKSVNLEKGDFRPVLDVERIGRLSDEKLRAGVKEWLHMAEEKYGVKPVLYTGLAFYKRYFEGHLKGYPLWIAAYDGEHRIKDLPWLFHQFTDRLPLSGVKEYVDGNTFRGDIQDLRKLCLH